MGEKIPFKTEWERKLNGVGKKKGVGRISIQIEWERKRSGKMEDITKKK
jgi:hypothetical protein